MEKIKRAEEAVNSRLIKSGDVSGEDLEPGVN